MGQARKRGTFEQRKAEGIERRKRMLQARLEQLEAMPMGVRNRIHKSRVLRQVLTMAVGFGLVSGVDEFMKEWRKL